MKTSGDFSRKGGQRWGLTKKEQHRRRSKAERIRNKARREGEKRGRRSVGKRAGRAVYFASLFWPGSNGNYNDPLM